MNCELNHNTLIIGNHLVLGIGLELLEIVEQFVGYVVLVVRLVQRLVEHVGFVQFVVVVERNPLKHL
jgi:hypothetical protein